MVYAEILYICKNKLGYTDREARHIYIGEYLEQFEIYKKFYNMKMNKKIFIEDKKEEQQKSDNGNPEWYNEYMRKQKGAKNGK